MARQAWVKSATGIYHVMLKGLDGLNIFLDDADRSIFMELLNRPEHDKAVSNNSI